MCRLPLTPSSRAGHLSRPGVETTERRRRRRPLAVTYVAYSPDGRHLLANLGSEQVYLFDAAQPRTADTLDTAQLNRPPPQPAPPSGEFSRTLSSSQVSPVAPCPVLR